MILVTGGAGVMGSRLVRGLVAIGRSVRVLTLPKDPFVSRLDGLGCDIAYGDVSDAATLRDVCKDVKTVYHLAAIILTHDMGDYQRINVNGTRNLVREARAAGAGHFIYVSSVSVERPDGSDYAQSKLAGEQIVKACDDLRWTIVRPTLVYDTAGGGLEFALFAENLRKWPIVPFVGRGRARKNPVHADDVVKGLLAIFDNARAYGKTYNFSGGEEVSMWELAKLIVRQQGANKPFVPVPFPLCRAIARLMEATMKRPPLTSYAISRFVQDAASDHTEASRDLGYDPIGVRVGLTSTSRSVGAVLPKKPFSRAQPEP